jgi:hypothetical protein
MAGKFRGAFAAIRVLRLRCTREFPAFAAVQRLLL